MRRSDRIRITLNGDVARTLVKEAARAGLTVAEVSKRLLLEGLAKLAISKGVDGTERTNGQTKAVAVHGPRPAEMKAVEWVLASAYGPKPRAWRRGTPNDLNRE